MHDDIRLEEIRERERLATPGPWQWRFYGGKEDPQLVAPHSGLLYIMDFVRRGMQGAEPRFADRTKNDKGRWQGGFMVTLSEWWKRNTNHVLPPDASFIAHSREDVLYLLAQVDSLQERLEAKEEDVETLRGELAAISLKALSPQVTGDKDGTLECIHHWAKRLSKGCPEEGQINE